MANPIQFTSRTFNSILADIDAQANLKGKPIFFKNLIAGLGDVVHRYIDAQANQSFLRTAFTRTAVQDKTELINYFLREQKTSTGIQRFNINPSASFPLNVSAIDLAAATESSAAVASLRFEARADVAFSPSAETFTAATNDELTIADTYHTGDLVQVSTTGTLPAGLAASTDHFVILISTTIIKLAASKADASVGTAIDITDTGTGTHTITSYALKVDVFQQETIPLTSIGTSDGSTVFQEFDLLHNNALKDTISIEIATVTWASVSTFVDSLITDKVYRIFYKTNGVGFIRFGDGLNFGEIPPTADVESTYAIGGGSASNVSVIGRINLYVGTKSEIQNTDNVTQMTGGQDPESIASAKRLAPELLAANDSFIKSSDAVSLTLARGGVTKVGVVANEFGLLSAGIHIIPAGGGSTTAQFKSDLEDFLTDKTILESIDVQVIDAVYVVQNSEVNVKIFTGFSFTNVSRFVDIAIKLFFTEVAQEIIDVFEGDPPTGGIAAAVDFINNKFSTSFATGDFPQIQKLLENLKPIDFGEIVDSADFIAYIRSFVGGVDNVVIVSPTFPIVLANGEVTQDGTVTVNQI